MAFFFSFQINDVAAAEENDNPFEITVEVAIAIGVITGIAATIFGIIWTIVTGRRERVKENLELIQNYGNQLSLIVNSEKELATKIDCTLYAEQYLDTLEQIATLYDRGMLSDDVAEYFENHFRYGIHLWKWYKKNVENLTTDVLEKEFIQGTDSRPNSIERQEELKRRKENQSDRWFYFRWWVNGGANDV